MVSRQALITRRAEDAIQAGLQPGERLLAGAALTAGPSPWNSLWVIAGAITLIAAALGGLFGRQFILPGAVLAAAGAAFPVAAIGLTCHPVYVAVSDQRLIGWRLTRFRRAPLRLAFAAPLAGLRITGYRTGRHGSSVRCEIPGQKSVHLHADRSGYAGFAELGMALRHSRAITDWDPPPYPLTPRGQYPG
jgi:hypothetical protein